MPRQPPADLRLPLRSTCARLRIGELHAARARRQAAARAAGAARSYTDDGHSHRIDDLSLSWDRLRALGSSTRSAPAVCCRSMSTCSWSRPRRPSTAGWARGRGDRSARAAGEAGRQGRAKGRGVRIATSAAAAAAASSPTPATAATTGAAEVAAAVARPERKRCCRSRHGPSPSCRPACSRSPVGARKRRPATRSAGRPGVGRRRRPADRRDDRPAQRRGRALERGPAAGARGSPRAARRPRRPPRSTCRCWHCSSAPLPNRRRAEGNGQWRGARLDPAGEPRRPAPGAARCRAAGAAAERPDYRAGSGIPVPAEVRAAAVPARPKSTCIPNWPANSALQRPMQRRG